MKKRGFTLIELLAVIVILAIIALITVPKIAEMIESSRKGAAEDAFYGVMKASELGYTRKQQQNSAIRGDNCNLAKTIKGSLMCENGTEVLFNGKVPERGTILIDSKGNVNGKNIIINGYVCEGDVSSKNPCDLLENRRAPGAEKLISTVVTSGDGLYKDSYGNGRYVYKGTNPNNYIKFNNQEWRIISVESDGSIKIMKNIKAGEPIEVKKFDLEKVRTTGYCALGSAPVSGCNAWMGNTHFNNGDFSGGSLSGIVDKDCDLNTYLNGTYYNNLSSIAKNQIQTYTFGVGGVYAEEKDPDDGIDIKALINRENSIMWIGNIALASVSDYLNANVNTTKCDTLRANNENSSTCSSTNWMFLNDNIWLLSPEVDSSSRVFQISPDGTVGSSEVLYSFVALPSLYLKYEIALNGKGTRDEPYTIITE